MKVVKLVAENVKKLKAVTIQASGNVIKVTGANEQGKTTVLDCIWWALGGTKEIQSQPIRQGEKKAKIVLDMGDIIATRKFTEAGSTLEVTNKDGDVKKSPQAVLDRLIGELSFDPLKFAKATKDVAVKMLLKIVDLKVDFSRLSQISGVDVEPTDNPIDAFNGAYKRVFDQRTDKNRQLETKKSFAASLAGIEKTERVDVVELVKKRDELADVNSDNERRKSEYNQKCTAVDLKQQDLDRAASKVEDLKKQLASAEACLAICQDNLNVAIKNRDEFSKIVDALEYKDLSEINEQIATANQRNVNAAKWEDAQKAIAERDALQSEADALTAKLDAIKAYKEELTQSAKFPIEGLDFGNGGVMYNGLPFEQASSAQKLQVSLAVAMALNPTLRVIRIDDGSLLDSKHMAIIEQMAAEKDYQVWMECVDESGKVGVVIEDGEVVATN